MWNFDQLKNDNFDQVKFDQVIVCHILNYKSQVTQSQHLHLDILKHSKRSVCRNSLGAIDLWTLLTQRDLIATTKKVV